MNLRWLHSAGVIALVSLSTPALADEGMWTFDNFPTAKVKAAYGVDIDAVWLDHVRGAAVRLSNGCSASIVTSRGLVLTANHCVAACAQSLSSTQTDFYTSGYIARTAVEERKCVGVQAEILSLVTDVTARMMAAGRGLAGEALVNARTAAFSAIEKEGCGDGTVFRCDVIELYHGGEYKLYKYRTYSDVRLIFSPGVTTSFFGGDPDNFNFPRYDLDAAIVRLYEAGKPAATPDHLQWNAAAPRAGEPVFVAGNPGSTDRQLTVAELESQRGVILPYALSNAAELRGRLIRFGEESADHKRIAQSLLFDLENAYKVVSGRLSALGDDALMEAKRNDEAKLKLQAMQQSAKLGADFGDPWTKIADAQQNLQAQLLAYRSVETGAEGSKLFRYARNLVRAGIEREKPSAQRLPGYADSQLPALEENVLDPQPVDTPVEQLTLEFWLSKARERLPVDDPNTQILLGRDSPEALSAALSRSRLGDPAVRKALWDGGLAAVQASDDPMIRYMVRIEPAARAIRSAWDEKVEGPTALATEKIAKARFAVYGESLYPDATSTLRLSYGKIDGWTYRGRTIAPFTYFAGLYERATGQDPFRLDRRWIAAQNKLKPDTVFDIATTNDIVGGNSGSPLINARGDVIGAVFDGNMHSLGGDYGYDPGKNRAVSVSTVAVTEALRKVYGANTLASELTGP